MYGNYDESDRLPEFSLYVGVNFWDTVKFDNASHVVIREILHVPLMDTIDVCLLDTGLGTPFISALELRHFHNSSYRTQSGSLVLFKRFDIGSTTNRIVRYITFLLLLFQKGKEKKKVNKQINKSRKTAVTD